MNIRKSWIEAKTRVAVGMRRLLEMIQNDVDKAASWTWVVSGQFVGSDMIEKNLGLPSSFAAVSNMGFGVRGECGTFYTLSAGCLSKPTEELVAEAVRMHWYLPLREVQNLAIALEALTPEKVSLAIDQGLVQASAPN